MWKTRFYRTLNILALTLAACSPILAQRPPPPTGTNPSAQDLTRPPGVSNPSPRTPPGTTDSLTPLDELTPATATGTRPASVTPNGLTPDDESGANAPLSNTGQPASSQTSTPSLLQPRTMSPMPTLKRVGVTNGETVALSLQDVVRLALARNNEIEMASVDVKLAETVLNSLEGFYDPLFRLTPEIINSVTPVASTLGGSDQSGTLTTTSLNLRASVIKPFRTGGGHYEFFFNNTRESTSSAFAQLTPFYSSSLGVQFTQPLLRNRSIDITRRAINIQKKVLTQTDIEFRRHVMNVIAEVQRAYWDLVFALREQQNQIGNVNLARKLAQQTETRIAAGASAPLERAEVQTEVASRESELIVASQNVSIAENNLKRLILSDSRDKEWPMAIMPTDEPSFEVAPVYLDEALESARSNRPELQRLRIQREINGIDLRYFTNQTRPRIDIVATVSTTGLAGAPVIPTGSIPGSAVPSNLDGGFGQTLKNLASFQTRNIVVGVVIEIPFKNRRAKADLAGARVAASQISVASRTQEQLIEVEVRNAAQSVESARQRVLSARNARENAEMQQKGERGLYEVGRSTTFLLFQRENQLASARSLELRALTDYNKALADLQRATSTTLSINNIVLANIGGR